MGTRVENGLDRQKNEKHEFIHSQEHVWLVFLPIDRLFKQT